LESYKLEESIILSVSCANMIQEKELLEKVDEWQAKARSDTDPFNKYVSIFIAYNIFYNLYAKKKSAGAYADYSGRDSHNAIATISLTKPDQLLKSLGPDLREYLSIIPVFNEEYWPKQSSSRSVPIARTLKASFCDGDAWNTVDLLIKWLYKVRCNLVHGEKSYKDENQRSLLEISTGLLDKILQHLECRYTETYGHPTS
jgi:hypothetical protein